VGGRAQSRRFPCGRVVPAHRGCRFASGPCQTVHAVLSHTASRHRSPRGMRSRVAHSSAEAIDTKAGEPGRCVAALPVPPVAAVFAARPDRKPFVDVAVDRGELPRRVTVAEVGGPTTKYTVEPCHDHLDRQADEPSIGERPDLGAHGLHRPLRRPPLQIPARRVQESVWGVLLPAVG